MDDDHLSETLLALCKNETPDLNTIRDWLESLHEEQRSIIINRIDTPPSQVTSLTNLLIYHGIYLLPRDRSHSTDGLHCIILTDGLHCIMLLVMET